MKQVSQKLKFNIAGLLHESAVWVFLAALLGSIVFGIITPIAQEADGAWHFYRAYDVAQGNVLLPFYNIHDPSFLYMPADIDDYVIGGVQPDESNGETIQKRMKKITLTSETAEFADPREVPAVYYYLPALGLKIAMTFGMTVYSAVILCHILSAIGYSVLAGLAAKYMPVGKSLFYAIMLCPVCLFQAASFSYDSLLNGLCFLAIALILDRAYGRERELGIKDMLPIGIILALIYMSKYVYVLIGLLVFLIPMRRFGSKKKYFITFGVAILPLVLYVLQRACFATVLPAYDMGDFVGLDKTGDYVSQMDFILGHPLELPKILARTFYRGLTAEFKTINVLGWGVYTLEPLTYWIPVFWAGVYVLGGAESVAVNLKGRILFGAATVLMWLGIVCGLYFCDPVANPAGYYWVCGLQGRYFVCLIPLLGIALAPKNLHHKIKNFDKKVVIIALVFALWAAYIFYKRCMEDGILNFY